MYTAHSEYSSQLKLLKKISASQGVAIVIYGGFSQIAKHLELRKFKYNYAFLKMLIFL